MIKYEEEIGKIAKNIKSIRKSKGLTVQELAYRCEIERSNLSRLEAGKTNMTIKTLCIICNALNVKLSEII
ncbi:MAG: helix-turn-helix transcriptional regulator [Rikenellaceae bacterium]|jgi:transcriptional regulator with XRE-family HTH domain|nr:helix-turn-helix transcriptional regulator [Rikenellaceae bacterium]MBQ3203404.1 helix-turn-helix transcriptional regulator [Alistipes sp.]MBR2014190.1 helix-turn-helix transcriptional regulator [Alistipes sp.]